MLFDPDLCLILFGLVCFFASYLIDSPHLTCIFAIVCFAPQELRRPNRSRLVQKEKEFFRNPLTETRVVQSHPGRGLAGLVFFGFYFSKLDRDDRVGFVASVCNCSLDYESMMIIANPKQSVWLFCFLKLL